MSAVRGISQYQQAGFAGFETLGGDASRSGSSFQNSQSNQGITAKVVTKTVGFQLGKFGVSYVSEEIQADSGSLPKAAAALTGASLSSNSFAAELDVAAVRDSLAMAQTLEYATAVSSGAAQPTALSRRLGARAYAQSQTALTSRTGSPGMFRAAV